MTISYIIPACNAENTLVRAIESIVTQKLDERDDLEILVVENGSIDGTETICGEMKRRYSCVKIFSSKKGVSIARNIALKHATGEILAFCDADDYVEPGTICKVMAIFRDHPETTLLVCGYNKIKTNKAKTMSYSVTNTEYWTSEKFISKMLYDNRVMGSVWNKFFRKDLVAGHFFNETLTHCEDLVFMFSVMNKRNDLIRMEPFTCYNYIYNSGSAVHQPEKLFNEQNRLNYIESYRKVLVMVRENKKLTGIVKYVVVSSSIQNYFVAQNDIQRKLLVTDVRNSFFSWLFRIYLKPKNEIIHLMALPMIGMCEMRVLDANRIREKLFQKIKRI